MAVDRDPTDSRQSMPSTDLATMNIAELRTLPIEQRLHLVEDLWDSIAVDQAPWR
jgi:uncharacterized tellurite resistance protein B-like protein